MEAREQYGEIQRWTRIDTGEIKRRHVLNRYWDFLLVVIESGRILGSKHFMWKKRIRPMMPNMEELGAPYLIR